MQHPDNPCAVSTADVSERAPVPRAVPCWHICKVAAPGGIASGTVVHRTSGRSTLASRSDPIAASRVHSATRALRSDRQRCRSGDPVGSRYHSRRRCSRQERSSHCRPRSTRGRRSDSSASRRRRYSKARMRQRPWSCTPEARAPCRAAAHGLCQGARSRRMLRSDRHTLCGTSGCAPRDCSRQA
jgi:hypothetical protein